MMTSLVQEETRERDYHLLASSTKRCTQALLGRMALNEPGAALGAGQWEVGQNQGPGPVFILSVATSNRSRNVESL